MRYRLPAYAVPVLNTLGLAARRNISAMDSYRGLVPGSFFQISLSVLFYESKLAVDGDGSGGQQEGDSDYQTDTSLHDLNGNALNSLQYPFMVLPQSPQPPQSPASRLEDFGVRLGDVGIAFWQKAYVPFVYGDIGPHGKIGEGSSFVASNLGLNPSPAVGGISYGEIPPGVIHLVFPGTTDAIQGRTFRTLDDIKNVAMTKLTALGITPPAPVAATV
jgi:Fungal chitosanase of glycosyl hydrolase group 75